MLQTLWILQTKESKSNDMANEKLYDSALRLLAYNGDSDAQYNIAKYYETNEVDIDQSIFWYRKAALQGHELAIQKCKELGADLNAPLIDREVIRKELQCRLFPLGYLGKYKYTVICTSYQGKWVLSRHKKRDTWETQGGHIEDGETPLEGARRELFEESGIKDADIYPICDYWAQIFWSNRSTNILCRMLTSRIFSVRFIPTMKFRRWPLTIAVFHCPCPRKYG